VTAPSFETFSLAAPAKINLTLAVTGKREDGYHLLESLVAFASVGDRLEFAPAETLSLACTGERAAGLPSASDNLVIKAALGFGETFGVAPRVALSLTKRLPVEAGLGGGSSDAAACLRGLARIFAVAETDPRLFALAARLGADVPVCLAGRASIMRGVGERLSPVALPDSTPIVLVNPGIGVATKAVFQRLKLPCPPPPPLDPARLASAEGLQAAVKTGRNDLSAPAIEIAPEIEQALRGLAQAPGCVAARMSGSGASCFALYADEAAAFRAAGLIARAYPAWFCMPCALVGDVRSLDGG
jgi:4-diphosphocytidyl-2-C-methyl-D-erythritol kinase